MKIHPHVFREYDIRGTVGSDLDSDFAYLLGRAFATLARENGKDRIGVGHDCRLSSDSFATNLAKGLSDQGVTAVRTGMGPTPQLYYAIRALSLGGGIQVTGSHNPASMNGFKLCLGTHTLSGSEIQDLRMRMERLLDTSPDALSGHIEEANMLERYTEMLVEKIKPFMGKRKLKVICDGGNGVGGMVGPKMLTQLGVEVIELYCEPDGNFPNHHPDPTELKNLKDLIAAVRSHKADFGIGWDGDADRIGVVDENGGVIFGDMLLLLYARRILEEEPGATIIGDVKCSSLLFNDLNKRGAKAIMWKTGHSLIKSKLLETGGALAGEMSGHIFFNHRFFGFDDALYASGRFCELVSHTEKPVSALLSDLPHMISTPEIRIDCKEGIKFKVAEAAKDVFKEFKVDTIDGARITFPEGWALVRASNTQPVLVMRFEATSEERITEYKKIVNERIEKIIDSF